MGLWIDGEASCLPIQVTLPLAIAPLASLSSRKVWQPWCDRVVLSNRLYPNPETGLSLHIASRAVHQLIAGCDQDIGAAPPIHTPSPARARLLPAAWP